MRLTQPTYDDYIELLHTVRVITGAGNHTSLPATPTSNVLDGNFCISL